MNAEEKLDVVFCGFILVLFSLLAGYLIRHFGLEPAQGIILVTCGGMVGCGGMAICQQLIRIFLG